MQKNKRPKVSQEEVLKGLDSILAKSSKATTAASKKAATTKGEHVLKPASPAKAIKAGGADLLAKKKNQPQKTSENPAKNSKTYFDKISRPMQASISKALLNITKLSDTDVFPRSFEISVLADSSDAVLDLVAKIHLNFQEMLISSPPVNDKVLAAVGYSGFRAVTQVDPVWNLYLLALVINLAEKIEAARVPAEKKVVHSYRYKSTDCDPHIFNSDFGWFSFNEQCEQLAKKHKFVLLTDISDFYPRIYHHRLENALKKIGQGLDEVKKIIKLLSDFSGGVSFGLPVGGPASRLLSELLLNSTDRMLLAERIPYARFVDDFRIFADSREEAHASLVMLAQKIGESEGLSLQKSKTRIMSSEEYLSLSGNKPEEADQLDDRNSKYRSFMSLKLHFDPYSESAVEDYDALRKSLRSFDIVGMLAREMRKTQIEESIVKKLIKSIRHLNPSSKVACITSLSDNLEILSPVFPLVMKIFSVVAPEITPASKEKMLHAIRKLFSYNSHIVQLPVNQAYAVKVLAIAVDEESEQILHRIYKTTSSIGVRRDVIVAMASRDLVWFVSDRRRNYQNLSSWEKRAVLAASYILEDEGAHWRKKLTLENFDSIIVSWTSDKKSSNNGIVKFPT